MAELPSVDNASFTLACEISKGSLDGARALVASGYTIEEARQIIARACLTSAANIAVSLGQSKEEFAADLVGFASRILSGKAEEDAKARKAELFAERKNNATPEEIAAAQAGLTPEQRAWAQGFEAAGEDKGAR